MSVHSYRNAKSTAQPKVGYLDNTIISNQQILRFQVPVEDSSLMAKENSLQNLWNKDNYELQIQYLRIWRKLR